MAVSDPSALNPTAVDAAKAVGLLEHVDAVCLLGSAARGDDDPSSDIDLLAVVDARENVPSVRSRVASRAAGRKLQVKVVNEVRLGEILATRSTFAVHILREAVAISDRESRFAALRAAHPADEPVRPDPCSLRLRLELYEDLAWCQGMFLYCLADCYAVGRAAAYAALGQRRIFEFSAPRALSRLAADLPDLHQAALRIHDLRPFFLLAERDVGGPLPFSYRGCLEEAEEAVQAARRLVDSLEDDGARR